MQNIKSKETIEDFIAKLPKESLFMRNRSRPLLSSETGDVKKVNKRNFNFHKENPGNSAGPLIDVSNQSQKTTSQHFFTSTLQKVIHEDAAFTEAGTQSSILPKDFCKQKRLQHCALQNIPERRSLAITYRTQPLHLSVHKGNPRPYSISKASQWSPFTSRLKDKASHMQLLRVKGGNSSDRENKPPNSAKKSPQVLTLTARRKMGVGIFSSTKKMRPVLKHTKENDTNEPNLGGPLGHNLNTTKDQECRRALQFQENVNINDEESTKPLPQVDLISSETEGSMLYGLKKEIKTECSATTTKAPVSSSTITNENSVASGHGEPCPKITKGNMFIASGTTKVPIVRRRSAIPICKRGISLNSKSTQLADITRATDTSVVYKSAPIKRKTENFPNKIPEIRILHPSSSSENEESLNRTFPSPSLNMTEKNGDKSKCLPITGGISPLPPPNTLDMTGNTVAKNKCLPVAAWISPPPPPNSPSAEAIKVAFVLPESSTDLVPQTETKSFKDASCNTVLSASVFQGSFLGAEKLVEETLAEQEGIVNDFESMVQEFQQKSKVLMMRYKATLGPIKDLRKQFAEKLHVQDVARETASCKKLTERSTVTFEENLDVKEDKMKKALKFLGTPLPRKAKKNRLTRSFTHPPSPEVVMSALSPELSALLTKDDSFHSFHSDYSPFTTCVGDCERPSLAPMTPLTRLNVTVLKESMNQQFQNLFD